MNRNMRWLFFALAKFFSSFHSTLFIFVVWTVATYFHRLVIIVSDIPRFSFIYSFWKHSYYLKNLNVALENENWSQNFVWFSWSITVRDVQCKSRFEYAFNWWSRLKKKVICLHDSFIFSSRFMFKNRFHYKEVSTKSHMRRVHMKREKLPFWVSELWKRKM